MVNIKAVMQADAKITIKSIGANTIPGMLSNTNPVPKLYKCRFSRIISPMYIRNVMAAAAIDGIQTETNLLFPKRNEPIKTPTVTPKRIKKISGHMLNFRIGQ